MNKVLTAKQVTGILRIPIEYVEAFLDSGRLRGFKITGGWRVRQEDLAEFLEAKVKEQEMEALLKALSDPKQWISVLQEFPDMVSEIKEKKFPANSFGKFLQDAISSLE